MSLLANQPPAREAGYSTIDGQASEEHSYTETGQKSQQHLFTSTDDTYDDAIVEFYTMDNDTQTPKSVPAVPALPPRSALRASKLIDNLCLKLGSPMEKTADLSQATPHDVYLSSEEDASSSADDFSDYDYDSASEAATSPLRKSHEITARAVSVVFYGKPVIVDLPLPRRSISPSSSASMKRVSTMMSVTSLETSSTTPSSSSSSLHRSAGSASLVPALLSRRKPIFLNIDPYATKSLRSLDMTREEDEESFRATKTAPRTPTTLFKGVSRTIGLMKKKSQAALITRLADSSSAPSDSQQDVTPTIEEKPAETESPQQAPPMSPSVTYNDIMSAAKKNLVMAARSPSLTDQPPLSPLSPTIAAAKRGILSGLAGRRRSIKFAGKVA